METRLKGRRQVQGRGSAQALSVADRQLPDVALLLIVATSATGSRPRRTIPARSAAPGGGSAASSCYPADSLTRTGTISPTALDSSTLSFSAPGNGFVPAHLGGPAARGRSGTHVQERTTHERADFRSASGSREPALQIDDARRAGSAAPRSISAATSARVWSGPPATSSSARSTIGSGRSAPMPCSTRARSAVSAQRGVLGAGWTGLHLAR